jgi:hypothetical protein
MFMVTVVTKRVLKVTKTKCVESKSLKGKVIPVQAVEALRVAGG